MAAHFDVIVVGGGHNGLVAAFYLAQSGLRTLVLERRPVVGGPSATVEYFPGYHAAITNSPGSLEPKIVRDMALQSFGLRFTRPDPSLVHPFDDGRAFVAWRDRDRVNATLRAFSDHDAVAYYRLFADLQAFADRLRVSLFEPPPSLAELVSRLSSEEDEEQFAKVYLGSIRDLLDERFESNQVKAVIAVLSVMHNRAGPATPGTPAMLMQRPLSIASHSVSAQDDPRRQPLRGSTGLPIGGMGAIPRAMEAANRQLGVEIRTGAEVARILVKDGRAYGVVLADGQEVEARIVLSNLNPRTTFLDLVDPQKLSEEFRDRVSGIRMQGSQFKIGLALDGLPRFAVAGSDAEAQAFASCQFRIAPSMDYMERAWDDAKYGRWSHEPMMWGLTPSVMDPELAPPGRHLMSVNVYHAPEKLADGDWAIEKERFGRQCIDVLSRYIPNLADIITDCRFWSPQDFVDEYGLVGANITHGDMLPGQMFSLRPLAGWSRYRTPVSGLYLCGSGTWPGGFISGIPGHNSSAAVLEDLRAGGIA